MIATTRSLRPQPAMADVAMPTLLEALSDATRLEVVRRLTEKGEMRCGDFGDLSSPSNMTYHLTKLREAGLVSSRAEGTSRIIMLRQQELDARFPGLLEAVLAGLTPLVETAGS